MNPNKDTYKKTSKMRSAARQVLDGIFGREPTLHRIPFGPIRGEKIFMSFNDGPSMYMGFHEFKNLKLAQIYINNGDVVYDVGAHVGYTSLFFSKLVSNDGSVHAFELIPSTANMLTNTVKNSNKQNIFIHNVGLGLEYAKKEFLFDDRNMGSIRYKFKNLERKSHKRFKALCEMYPLDEYISSNDLDPPSFIKVDIEGAEIDFLHGAINSITKYKPDLMVEFHGLSLLERGYKYFNDIDYTMLAEGSKNVNKEFINNLSMFHGESCFCFANGKYNDAIF